MVDIVDTPSSFVVVPRVEVSDIALGGNEINVPNKQYKALAQRDRFLKDQVDALIAALGSTTPIPGSVKLFGGSGGQGNYTLNSGTDTFTDGFYYFNNFTIAAGATLNITQFAKILCLGTVSIAGSIVVSPLSSGGASIGTYNIPAIGGLSGSGPGGGSGAGGLGGQAYNYAAAPYGSGGASGILNAVSGSGVIAGGGRGGGGLWIEAAGTVTVTSTANLTAIGSNGGSGLLSSGSGDISGGGGGAGGLLLLSSLVSVSVSGTLDVRGGTGGNAVVGNAGGGGGGQVVLIAPVTTTTGATIVLTAGTAGSNTGTGAIGGGTGGGFGGSGGGSAATVGKLITRNFKAVG